MVAVRLCESLLVQFVYQASQIDTLQKPRTERAVNFHSGVDYGCLISLKCISVSLFLRHRYICPVLDKAVTSVTVTIKMLVQNGLCVLRVLCG